MLWVVTAFDGITLPAEFSVSTVGFLVAAAALSCAANALWTIAVLRGNVALIGTLSYFTPYFPPRFPHYYSALLSPLHSGRGADGYRWFLIMLARHPPEIT